MSTSRSLVHYALTRKNQESDESARETHGMKTEYGVVYFFKHPHMNCQNFAIACMNALVSQIEKDKLNNEEIKTVFRQIRQPMGGKRRALIDVRRPIGDKIQKILVPAGVQIIFRTDYISSNNNEMCVMLLDLKFTEEVS